ncbi:MAG: mechanosensitive ion channel [Burkholderiales bacterium]|nr:mechanosensitive ion channel [Burkholderiales bacterium]
MLAPIDFSRLENALANPRYGWELALVLVCLAVAWVIDRALEKRARERLRAREDRRGKLHPRLSGGVGRIAFSLVALALLALVRPVFHAVTGGKPFFLDIAIPLLIALAVIRVLVYVMRRFFAQATWLKTSERAIALAIWLLVILYFVGLLPLMATELDEMQIPIGKGGVSLLTIFKGAAAVLVTLVIALWLSGLIEQRLSNATTLDNNVRAILGRVVRAVLLTVGVLIALETIGFDLTLLTVFGGALGVGVGLGLQKFAANYIAGFTILLDKSIRLDDMITVDGRQGRVAKVTSRYVVLRSLDGIEALVPNETLISTTVLNHSHAVHNVRLASNLRIAYDADVERALALMVEATHGEPRVLGGGDAPAAFVNGLSENGVDLELVLWISGGPVGSQAIRSAVHRRILASFAREGIAIAPQRRDVRYTAAGDASGALAATPAPAAGRADPPSSPAS